ncbi:collagen alpha-6(VI) chain-like [Styela clava]
MWLLQICFVLFCFANLKFSFAASSCEPLGILKYGKIQCSPRKPVAGSTCSFKCNEGFKLIPAENTKSTCKNNGKWTKSKPCCRGCSTDSKKDIVVVMDSSGSIEPDQYEIMKKFIANVIGSFKGNGVQFSVVRFASQVFDEDSIFFGTFNGNKKALQKAVRGLDGPGGRTFLGEALVYTREVMFARGNGNRKNVKDMVWVVTDGAASDEVDGPAKALRDDGVEIVALGIRQEGKAQISVEELNKITGNKKNVIEIKGMSELTDKLREVIVSKMCDLSCEEVKPPQCPPLPKLPNGKITCSFEEAIAGTSCTFECKRGFKLMPTWKKKTDCKATTGGKAEWTEKLPCCGTETCTSDAKKDIIIVMDSSGSIEKDQYKIMKNFIAKVIGSFQGNGVQFSVIRFGSVVFVEDTIYFGDYRGNKGALQRAVKDLDGPGGRTFLGEALDFAKTDVLSHEGNRRNVKDMVWVVTDGAASDEVKGPAARLRSRGVEILALGIRQEGKAQISMKELREITGNDENVIEIKGMSNLTEQLRKRIVNKICESSCGD